jgi:hypothetical protein
VEKGVYFFPNNSFRYFGLVRKGGFNMTPIIELIRLEEDHRFGTIGVLKVNKKVFCFTLEPPDKLNASNISSIPAQQYMCKRYSSPKYPDTFQVKNVPGRTSVLIHAGNKVDDTAGCILLGDRVDKLGAYDRAILNSGNTFRKFMKKMDFEQEFHLTIREVY